MTSSTGTGAAIGLLALLLLPGAQACSFIKEPPGPGAFYVWDTRNDPVAFAVQQRGLGAGCELSNLHAVDHRQFAWLEGDVIKVRELAHAEPTGVGKQSAASGAWSQRWTGTAPQDLALADGDLLVRENTGSAHQRVHKVWRLEADGTQTLLYSTTHFGTLHGAFYVTTQGGLGIVDVRTREVVAEAKTARERGFLGPDEPNFLGTDGRYLVYETARNQGHTLHIHDLRGGWRDVRVEGYAHGQQVADGHLYSVREGNLTIVALGSGGTSQAQVPSLQLLGAGGGHVVLGAYSAGSVSGHWRAPFADQGIPLPVWLVAAALVVAARRRRPDAPSGASRHGSGAATTEHRPVP